MPRSVMEHSFSEVPRVDIPRSSFNRSHGIKTAFDADLLIPIIVDDIFPGDTFNVNFNFFARLATPIHPIMDNIYLETFFFFVPYRLLWSNWEKFCGSQLNPADSIDFTIPVLSGAAPIALSSISDYMGLPLGLLPNSRDVSALPFRAYNLIFDEWFRDQNLQNASTTLLDNGPDSLSGNYLLLKRGKRHDYFTSCLPWPQKGGTAAPLPLGTSAPVIGLGFNDSDTQGISSGATVHEFGGTRVYPFSVRFDLDSDDMRIETLGPVGAAEDAEPQIRADLSLATGANINDLRLAFQTQRLLERDARSGTRYNETILAHFGVTVPDFRVQRPEFLGGGSSPINITPVANTSDTATENQGDLAGFGTVNGVHGFTKSFTEHGVLLGLINARADITYSQGLERYWSKATRFDFYYPVLSQIGEQAVLNKEIWQDNSAADELVFGYQERYAEYRYKPARLTSLMRPDAAGTLAAWHLSEDFATLPALGATFIQSNTGVPLDRAIAVATEPHFILDGYFDMKCARPMPLYGVPGNLDHF